MDVENRVLLWVDWAEPNGAQGFWLDGLVFDGELGFGGEELRDYEGPLHILSKTERSTISAELTYGHISGRGGVWHIDAVALPSAPFLLTNCADLQGPFTREITVLPTEEARQTFLRHGEVQLPVRSRDLIGVLDHGAAADVLTYFRMPGVAPERAEVLYFTDWGLEAGSAEIG